MADKGPKPPSIAPPKIVPGKETARSIGIDTAFIDGLAAGLVDEADLPPPPPARKPAEATAKVEAPAKAAAPAKRAKQPAKVAARKMPAPKGLSEGSGPLFRVQESAKKDDEDPLAMLLGDVPSEQPSSSSSVPFVPPTPRDDLLARLAKDDDDGSVSLTKPVMVSKSKSESSGVTARSERSGDMPLPKGTDAPVFEAKVEPAKVVPAKTVVAETKAVEAKPVEAKPKIVVAEAAKPKKSTPPPAIAPVVAVGSAATKKVHPGVWLLLAAVLFGVIVPIVAGGSAGEPAPPKTNAERRGADAKSAAVIDRDAPVDEEDVEEPEVAAGEEAAPVEEEEELVELDEEDAAVEGGDGSQAKAKSGGGDDGKGQKGASQLLNDAKTAYSQGRNGDAYRLAGAAHRQRASEDALIVRAKAACRMGNEGAAKRAFEDLPMGGARREVRPICRDKGIRLGI